MENHSSAGEKVVFFIQILQISAAVAIATFEIYGSKFTSYLFLIGSFNSC